ncbi:Hypothetical predicted protein [Paramuricea clavata]|uniref:C-type lectin domain-containing protein n=1 Tax=Paramuricea clavata TaxID=317549 RepID=A0A7D9E4H1_PARCT|nr:Hypothetical predicted protein [Paramuricea clavata]
MKRVCPDCRSMYVGAEKNGNKWSWLDSYNNTDMTGTLWGAAEPQAENSCAEYDTELHVLTTLACNTPRGYMCRYQWL